MEIIKTNKSIGINFERWGFGIIKFPWIRPFNGQPRYSISFWQWLIDPDGIKYMPVTHIQLRFMWFAIIIKLKEM